MGKISKRKKICMSLNIKFGYKKTLKQYDFQQKKNRIYVLIHRLIICFKYIKFYLNKINLFWFAFKLLYAVLTVNRYFAVRYNFFHLKVLILI